MTIGQRIEIIIIKENIKKIDFAKRVKIDPSYVSKIISDKEKKQPSDRIIDDICNEFNINKSWLLTGKGEMYLQFQENEIVKQASILLGQKDPIFEAFVLTYSKLKPENRKILLDYGLNFLENLPSNE